MEALPAHLPFFASSSFSSRRPAPLTGDNLIVFIYGNRVDQAMLADAVGQIFDIFLAVSFTRLVRIGCNPFGRHHLADGFTGNDVI